MKPHALPLLRAVLVALPLAATAAVHAAPCAGFDDVDAASAFCPNVEWIRNRAVTLGCSATQFCPDGAVSRLSLAAFVNRLGSALTPVELRTETAPGAIDLDGAAVVCQTGDAAAKTFPRHAQVDAVLAMSASADTGVGAELVMSGDGGASWTPIVAAAHRGYAPADRWGTLSTLGAVDVDAGASVRFGMRLSRGGLPGSGGLADSRCSLRAQLVSRDG